MNRLSHILVAAVVLVLSASGCSESLNPFETIVPDDGVVAALDVFYGEPLVVSLITHQGHEMGSVTISNDETLLYVTIATQGDRVMSRTHVAVSTSLESFPGHGHPRINDLTFFMRHNRVTEYTYEVPLGESWLESNQDLVIAVRALIVDAGPAGRSIGAQWTWMDGEAFPGHGWRTYVGYTVQSGASGGDCTITMMSPNGGEMFCHNQYAEIIWESIGEECGEYVSIELLHAGQSCLIIDGQAVNTGLYEWYEVQQCGQEFTGYTIRVTDLESGASDESDGPFIIDYCPE